MGQFLRCYASGYMSGYFRPWPRVSYVPVASRVSRSKFVRGRVYAMAPWRGVPSPPGSSVALCTLWPRGPACLPLHVRPWPLASRSKFVRGPVYPIAPRPRPWPRPCTLSRGAAHPISGLGRGSPRRVDHIRRRRRVDHIWGRACQPGFSSWSSDANQMLHPGHSTSPPESGFVQLRNGLSA